MRLRETPADFVVTERVAIPDAPRGTRAPVALFWLDKRGLSTPQALLALARTAGVPREALHVCGRKDAQAETTQLLGVTGDPRRLLRARVPGLRLRDAGRAATPPDTSWNRGNVFRIVVRDLGADEAAALSAEAPAVARDGLPDYFDDQRFGAIRHGQGFPAREALRGDDATALRLLVATPSRRHVGRRDDPRSRRQGRWGDFDRLAAEFPAGPLGDSLRHLQRAPTDAAGALARLDRATRVGAVQSYQSFLWNALVSEWIAAATPPADRLVLRVETGPLIAYRRLADPALPARTIAFPASDAATQSPAYRSALEALLRREGLAPDALTRPVLGDVDFRPGTRPLIVVPESLVVASPVADPRRPGRVAVTVSFALPPGAYGSLVIKRLACGFRDSAPSRSGKPRHRRRRPRG